VKENTEKMRTLRLPTHRPPTTVGEILEEDFRKELGLTQEDFARRLGIDRVRYSALVNGRRSLTIDTARRLEKVLGPSLQFWMNLQYMTDVYAAMHAPKSAEIEALKPLLGPGAIEKAERMRANLGTARGTRKAAAQRR